MQTTVQEIYIQVVRNLSLAEQLRLATLILNDLVKQQSTAIDESDTWTEEDERDLVSFSLQSAASNFSEIDEAEQ
ncbi:hypothetical protein RIF25_07965 [Thermosynechococcaceae cyanobacterium BACA0444]|uniref:Uncharacterized protein n=1 Tax=Pseudocalidococcus azoricus BACA0444 TaxID=2918990 RepID=A0AAE4FR36_9CYAN|nr:hypothetical protein [Pseudocalidococcus azoricus]MDS3860748.1 hypothetical protein [Pseudocalidococcus azoricus BACA0444]